MQLACKNTYNFYNNSAICMDTLVAYYANLMCALYIVLTIIIVKIKTNIILM